MLWYQHWLSKLVCSNILALSQYVNSESFTVLLQIKDGVKILTYMKVWDKSSQKNK